MTSRARGARAVFPAEQVVAVKAIACELPAVHSLPLGRFTRTALHRLVIERGVADGARSALCGGGAARDSVVRLIALDFYGGPGADQLYGGPGIDYCNGGPGVGRSHGCERGPGR